jgi:hypothetical protein
MSEYENQEPIQDTIPSTIPTTEKSNASPDQLPAKCQQSNSSSNDNGGLGGCSGSALGCVGGFVYLVVIFMFFSQLKQIGFNILAAIVPICVFYVAKRKNTVSFFWGFLIPYMLLLLLYGMCGNMKGF